MSKDDRLVLQITAEIAIQKFFLREMLFYFIYLRKGVPFDDDFSFTGEGFSDYITNAPFTKTLSIYINDSHLIECLSVLRERFYKRDKFLRIKEPREGLLDFTKKGQGESKIFIVKNCPSEYINNAIRYLDISLMLCSVIDDKNRIEDLELVRKVGSINDASLFGQTQDHKLTFCNKTSVNPLGSKEKAILQTLINNFNQDVDYKDLYISTKNATLREIPSTERKGYINDGITQLRQKLCEISGNPNTISSATRGSIYKLVY